MLQKIINKTETLKILFRLLLIVAFCLLCNIVLFSITAFIITKTDFTYEILVPLTGVNLGVTSFVCGLVVSKCNKENGLICGVFTAGIINAFLIILSLYNNTFNLSVLLVTKICFIFFAGMAGGIIGVNSN